MAPLSFPLKEIGTRAELARRLGVDVRAVDLFLFRRRPAARCLSAGVGRISHGWREDGTPLMD